MSKNLWPKYIGAARYNIPLSKTNSEFPRAEDIRTIAILPAWSKVMETAIL